MHLTEDKLHEIAEALNESTKKVDIDVVIDAITDALEYEDAVRVSSGPRAISIKYTTNPVDVVSTKTVESFISGMATVLDLAGTSGPRLRFSISPVDADVLAFDSDKRALNNDLRAASRKLGRDLLGGQPEQKTLFDVNKYSPER